jgi:hypothetical protein
MFPFLSQGVSMWGAPDPLAGWRIKMVSLSGTTGHTNLLLYTGEREYSLRSTPSLSTMRNRSITGGRIKLVGWFYCQGHGAHIIAVTMTQIRDRSGTRDFRSRSQL